MPNISSLLLVRQQTVPRNLAGQAKKKKAHSSQPSPLAHFFVVELAY
jgi:hypothetical protein